MSDLNFKSLIEADLKTFINPNEFGELAIIEGEEVIIVTDAETMKERQLAKEIEGELHEEELLFYVEKEEISFYPRSDNIVIIDEVQWKITDVQEDQGLFTITAELVSG